ncbi:MULTISPECIES: DUF1830 domain-containing protein [unclassified Pseudanabaena]|uniref:DUF1830 domain-containing protein n=1 Tax=unclassified Pseudanabaena TaxID=2593292 RepID=UPI0006D7B12F|nr:MULTISPECIES: DUF1830 domain-containing protein [unclassified Pseudanabaena]TYQ26920.1 DUF1830 domain-containing protein [Pseudanabaena sp. UWO310]
MSIFDPLPADLHDEKIVCSYVNATSKIQIARITNVPQWYFERVVFPGQNLIFEAIASAHVEIHTGMMASSILSDTIPCVQLQVEEASSTLPSWVPIKSIDPIDAESLENPSVLLVLPEPEVVS